MIRRFIIKDIADDQTINELSLKLNRLGEVSHIKIKDDNIEFDCIDTKNVLAILEEIDLDLNIQEIIDEKEIDYEREVEVREYLFFLENSTNDECDQILEVLNSYSSYENVSFNRQNKVLRLTTTDHFVLERIKRIAAKINADINVEDYTRPFRADDFFNRIFTRYFVLVLAGALAFGIAIVTRREPTIITKISWLVVVLVLLSSMLENVLTDLKRRRYFTEDLLMTVSALLGWLFGYYYEMMAVVLVYLVSKQGLIQTGMWVMEAIDKKIELIEYGNIVRDGGVQRVPLGSIDIGDQVLVKTRETINFDCELVSEQGVVNSYAVDGDDNDKIVTKGESIRAGCTNLGENIKIKVNRIYQSSALNLVASRATSYAMNESRILTFMVRFAKAYTILLIMIGIGMIIASLVMGSSRMDYIYIGILLISISSNASYVQAISFSSLGAVANSISKNIVVKNANSIYRLSACDVIIYDRIDNQPLSMDELDLFETLRKTNKTFIVFNDGPQDFFNDQYQVRNNLSTEEKQRIIDDYNNYSTVAYIGDSTKDISLLQMADVGISRGGVLAKRVIRNSDIVLKDSSKETMLNAFKISNRYRHVVYQYVATGLIGVVAIFVLAVAGVLPWTAAVIIDVLINVIVTILNRRIINL